MLIKKAYNKCRNKYNISDMAVGRQMSVCEVQGHLINIHDGMEILIAIFKNLYFNMYIYIPRQ